MRSGSARRAMVARGGRMAWLAPRRSLTASVTCSRTSTVSCWPRAAGYRGRGRGFRPGTRVLVQVATRKDHQMASLEELRPINRIRAAAERGGGLDASDEEALFAALAPEEAERAAVDAEWRAWRRHPATHQHEADGSVIY